MKYCCVEPDIWLDFPQKESILEFNTKQYKDEKLPLNQGWIFQNQAQAPLYGVEWWINNN